MLTIPLDRVMELLDKAADVEVPVLPVVEDETEDGAIMDIDALDDILAEDPAYQALIAALEGLSPQELRELLALSLLARSDGGSEVWQPMIEQAHAVPEDDRLDILVSTLLLTDDIEQALERLGYAEEESEDETDEDEEEEEEVAHQDETAEEGQDEDEEEEEEAESREKAAD